tara:strand:- start:1659 stop:2561 length:903 start_codon:yes stop_codon:yes gene_type:complete
MIEYHRKSIANVKVGDFKSAALFFSHVIPLSARALSRDFDDRFNLTKERFDNVLYSLLPDDLTKGGQFHNEYNLVLKEAESLRMTSKHFMKLGMYLDEAIQEEGIDFRANFNNAIFILESKSNSYKSSTQLEYDHSQNKYQEGDDIIISLLNLQMIDTYNTSWEQILEFRKDKNSIKNLRKLKLFLYDNYLGKPASYIEDDILNRIEDYNKSISKWGFNTITTTFDSILSSKGLFATSTIAMLAAFNQNPSLAALSGGSAAFITMGQIGISIFKARNNKIALRTDSPLAYLLTAKKKLNQ